jgi:hypothetical protein
VKLEPRLVRDLKLFLEQMVAARRQYHKSFLAQKTRQARRLRSENWLVALDRAVGRSATHSIWSLERLEQEEVRGRVAGAVVASPPDPRQQLSRGRGIVRSRSRKTEEDYRAYGGQETA